MTYIKLSLKFVVVSHVNLKDKLCALLPDFLQTDLTKRVSFCKQPSRVTFSNIWLHCPMAAVSTMATRAAAMA